VSGGPYELEFWPGPPGTGTVRVLVTGHDLDICILPNNLNTCPNIRDFTGAILFKGPPRIIELVQYSSNAPSGTVSGSYTTTSALYPYSFSYTVNFAPPPITSGPVDFRIMEIPANLGITPPFSFPISIAGTADIAGNGPPLDSVTVVGVLQLALDPLELHYAWRYVGTNAFQVLGGAATLLVDLDTDGTIDFTILCTPFSTGQVDVETYHDPDTGDVTIATSGTITTTCQATNVDVDGDGADDTITITVDIDFNLVHNTGGVWPPTTLNYVSGFIDAVPQTLEIDINGDTTIDFTFTGGVSATGPTTVNLNPDPTDRVDRYENTVNSLSCTLTGDIPVSGTATGTATCTGDVDFTIDIYNDGTPDVTVFGRAISWFTCNAHGNEHRRHSHNNRNSRYRNRSNHRATSTTADQ
jgi:hypothetical protein